MKFLKSPPLNHTYPLPWQYLMLLNIKLEVSVSQQCAMNRRRVLYQCIWCWNNHTCNLRLLTVYDHYLKLIPHYYMQSVTELEIHWRLAFWDIASCFVFEVDRRFRGVYCPHHHPMVEAVRISETSVYFNQTTWRYIQKRLSSSYLLAAVGTRNLTYK
jgi:hypothetical protein